MTAATDACVFVSTHEGTVTHCYLDSDSLLTFGCGFRPPLNNYPWRPNLQYAIADAAAVQEAGKSVDVAKTPADYYRPFCKAILAPADCQIVLAQKLGALSRQLQTRGWPITLWPPAAQVAVLDMAYNLGLGGLDKYPKLKAACLIQDWQTAAAECLRHGVGDARNADTRRLFESC